MFESGPPPGTVATAFPAATREEAERQARYTELYLAGSTVERIASRWDERASALFVLYGPPVAQAQQRRPATLRGVLVVALVVALGAVVGVSDARPGVNPTMAMPESPPAPSPTPGNSPAEDGEVVPRFEPSDCRSEWLWGRQTDCGDLVVLEDRSDPGGARIRLHVAIQRSDAATALPDPVVYLDGGPGGSPLTDGFWAYPFVAERDLIVIDQRGVGLSQPSLDCSEVLLILLREEIDALRDCRRRLVRKGIDLAAYNSAASAADLDELREVLGYEQWNLYGISYGSRLALTILRDHPSGVRSVILDGVYPPQADLYGDGPANAQNAFDRLFAACGWDGDCVRAFPDIADRFYLLVERLNTEPTMVGAILGLGGTEIDGSTLMWLVFQRMYVTEYLGEIPAAIDAFWNDDWQLLEEWIVELVGFRRAAGFHLLSEGAYYSVQCAEELPFSDQDRLLYPDVVVTDLVGAAFDWSYTVEVCEMWNVPPAAAVEDRPVVSDVPALLLAGSYDPITPPSWAREAAETLSAGQAFEVPGVGHGALGTSWCVDDIVTRFLAEPLDEVGAACLADLGEPLFTTR